MFTVVYTLKGWFVWIDWPVLGNKIGRPNKVHWETSYDWLLDSYDIGSLFDTRSASLWGTSCWLDHLCKFAQREKIFHLLCPVKLDQKTLTRWDLSDARNASVGEPLAMKNLSEGHLRGKVNKYLGQYCIPWKP